MKKQAIRKIAIPPIFEILPLCIFLLFDLSYKLNFFDSLTSILLISVNSLKKYGLK